MIKHSNIDAVKSTAISFLYLEIEKTSYSPIFVTHPIFENGFYHGIDNNGENKFFDLFNEDDLQYVQHCVEEKILNSTSIFDIYNIIRKSYRLTFLKFIVNYLSIDDMSSILSHAWVTSENPNKDVNVSVKTLSKLFRQSNKKILMNHEDYDVYQNFSETITVYRGVATNSNPNGLSWTLDKSIAEWFANRFDSNGYVQTITVNKSNILAYFNCRNEQEVIVDVLHLTNNR